MLKAIAAAACIWLACGASALAQEAPSEARLALAREVMVLSGGENTFNQMMVQMRPMIVQDMRTRGVSQEAAERFYEVMVEEFALEAPRFMELGAIAYANAFTDQELIDIAAFLRTPSGRAMMERQPEVAGAMMRAGAIIGAEITPRIAERMRQLPPPHTP